MVNFRKVNEDDILKNGIIVWKVLTYVIQMNKIENMNLSMILLEKKYKKMFLNKIKSL